MRHVQGISATVLGQGTAQADVSLTRRLAVAVAGGATGAADLVRTFRLAAAVVGRATVSAPVVREHGVRSNVIGLSTTTSRLTNERPLTALVDGVSAAGGFLLTPRPLDLGEARADGLSLVAAGSFTVPLTFVIMANKANPKAGERVVFTLVGASLADYLDAVFTWRFDNGQPAKVGGFTSASTVFPVGATYDISVEARQAVTTGTGQLLATATLSFVVGAAQAPISQTPPLVPVITIVVPSPSVASGASGASGRRTAFRSRV